MAVGGNRNTAYCHALFTYNQRVKCIGDRCGNKNRKTFSYRNQKVGVNHFLLYHLHVLTIVPKSWTSLYELIHFISRLHLLHFTSSSTSLSWHIRLRWLKESTELAEWDGCISWRSRMQWLKETNAIAEGVECSDQRRRMRLLKESNAIAEGDTFAHYYIKIAPWPY